MLHDATVEATCDHDGCLECVYVHPPYVYMNRAGGGGHYDTSNATLNRLVAKEEGWTVQGEGDDAKHYCEAHGGSV